MVSKFFVFKARVDHDEAASTATDSIETPFMKVYNQKLSSMRTVYNRSKCGETIVLFWLVYIILVLRKGRLGGTHDNQ